MTDAGRADRRVRRCGTCGGPLVSPNDRMQHSSARSCIESLALRVAFLEERLARIEPPIVRHSPQNQNTGLVP